jgi:hypothetical protein
MADGTDAKAASADAATADAATGDAKPGKTANTKAGEPVSAGRNRK